MLNTIDGSVAEFAHLQLFEEGANDADPSLLPKGNDDFY